MLEREDGGTVPFLSGLTAVKPKGTGIEVWPCRVGRQEAGEAGLYPRHAGKPLEGLAEGRDIPDAFLCCYEENGHH